MNLWTPRELCDSIRPERVNAVIAFGFTERQARFLVHVLIHSGVFIERQYRAFAGIAHGQNTHDFLAKLVSRGYATAITPGALHRGRLFHVQYKPLYEAIGEPNNRNRKPASLGRFVERLMLLDAVLADRHHGWLGTERDKVAYFSDRLQKDLPREWYPHLTFGEGKEKTTRYFPEKLPIGVPRDGGRRHVFLYLVTREVPAEFRLFLLRHADLLKWVDEWTIRVLVPRRFRKAAALYRYALRDAFTMPLTPADVDRARLVSFGRARARRPTPLRTRISTSARARGSSARRASGRSIGCGNEGAYKPCGPSRPAFFTTICNADGDASNSRNSHTSTCSSRPWLASPEALRRRLGGETTQRPRRLSPLISSIEDA